MINKRKTTFDKIVIICSLIVWTIFFIWFFMYYLYMTNGLSGSEVLLKILAVPVFIVLSIFELLFLYLFCKVIIGDLE